jgi:enoyl-CoA hydratase
LYWAADRAERIGLVTEVVPHDRLLARAVELASQIAEVPAPIMAGLKEIYVTGSAAITDPALAAEQDIAGAQQLDRDGLGARYTEISERNRRQIRPQP